MLDLRRAVVAMTATAGSTTGAALLTATRAVLMSVMPVLVLVMGVRGRIPGR